MKRSGQQLEKKPINHQPNDPERNLDEEFTGRNEPADIQETLIKGISDEVIKAGILKGA